MSRSSNSPLQFAKEVLLSLGTGSRAVIGLPKQDLHGRKTIMAERSNQTDFFVHAPRMAPIKHSPTRGKNSLIAKSSPGRISYI